MREVDHGIWSQRWCYSELLRYCADGEPSFPFYMAEVMGLPQHHLKSTEIFSYFYYSVSFLVEYLLSNLPGVCKGLSKKHALTEIAEE